MASLATGPHTISLRRYSGSQIGWSYWKQTKTDRLGIEGRTQYGKRESGVLCLKGSGALDLGYVLRAAKPPGYCLAKVNGAVEHKRALPLYLAGSLDHQRRGRASLPGQASGKALEVRGTDMKFTYEEPEPMKYEVRVVEISTGKVVCTYQVPEGQTVTRVVFTEEPSSYIQNLEETT